MQREKSQSWENRPVSSTGLELPRPSVSAGEGINKDAKTSSGLREVRGSSNPRANVAAGPG